MMVDGTNAIAKATAALAPEPNKVLTVESPNIQSQSCSTYVFLTSYSRVVDLSFGVPCYFVGPVNSFSRLVFS